MLIPEGPLYQLGADFRFQPSRRILERAGEAVAIPSRAFDVLTILVEERHRAVTKDELSDRVWGGVAVTQNNLNQSITALRKVFGDSRQSSQFIATIPNVGYQFVAAVTIIDEPAPQPPPMPWRRYTYAAACVVLALVLTAAWRWHAAAIPIAVAPFVNLQQDDNYDWLPLTLTNFASFAVGFSPSHDPLQLPSHLPTPAEVRKLASNLRAGSVAIGSFIIPAPNTIRIRLALHNASSGQQQVPLLETEGPLNDLAALVTDLARKLRQSAHQPHGTLAIERYAEGLAQWHNGDLPNAHRTLRAALTVEPRHPLILSALGAVLGELGHTAESVLLHQRAAQLCAALPTEQKLQIEARYRASLGDWPAALKGLTDIWLRHPDQLDAPLELAAAQFRARKPDDAQQTLETLSGLVQGAVADPRVLLLQARIQGHFGKMEQVRQFASRAAAAAHERGWTQIAARALLLQAGATQNLGHLTAANQLREQAKALCTQLDDRVCLSSAWRVQGNALLPTGATQAASCYWNALRLARVAGNAQERLNVLNGLATAMMQDHKFELAETVYRDALTIDLRPLGMAPEGLYNGLAETLIGQGRFREAEETSVKAARLAEAAAQRESAANAYLALARARAAQGDNATVPQLYEKSLRLFQEVGNPERTKEALIHYARFLVEKKDFAGAEHTLQKAASTTTPFHQGMLVQARAELRNAQLPARR